MKSLIQLRLTGRPEMERSLWIVEDSWDRVNVLTDQGRVRCVPTGDYQSEDIEIWIPESRRTDWPPTESEKP